MQYLILRTTFLLSFLTFCTYIHTHICKSVVIKSSWSYFKADTEIMESILQIIYNRYRYLVFDNDVKIYSVKQAVFFPANKAVHLYFNI